MLKKFRLHNFRTYLNAEFSFTRLHLVVGKNNSGKTNLCAAMQFLAHTSHNDLAKAMFVVPGGAWEATNWNSKSDTFELSCECELPIDGESCVFAYHLDVETKRTGQANGPTVEPLVPRVTREELTVSGTSTGDQCLISSDGTHATVAIASPDGRSRRENGQKAPRDSTMLSKIFDSEQNRYAFVFREYLSSWLFFTLSPEKMRFGWQDSDANARVLSVSGVNLAVVLYNLKNFEERRYRRVVEAVRQIEPGLLALNFAISPGQPPVPFVELEDCSRASWVGLSDGTLRYLAYAYLAEVVSGYTQESAGVSPPLIYIEEPENGLFPGQIRALLELFEGTGGGAQFVFTSHSPYFINLFDGRRDAVTLLRKQKDRTETVRLPPPDDTDSERPLLAEQYSMGLFD